MDLADRLTASRATCGVALALLGLLPRAPRALLIALFCWGVISDWIDGPLARRRGETAEGRARDLRADSLLTLGAAIAALRHARLLWPALLAPAAHYLARAPRDDDERRWDRATGVAQMSLFALSLARPAMKAWVAPAVIAARCAHLATRLDFRSPTGGGPLGPHPRREDR